MTEKTLDNQKLIKRMDLIERIKFLLSGEENKTATVSYYDYPALHLTGNLWNDANKKNGNMFPSIVSLGFTWNEEQIQKNAYYLAKEMNFHDAMKATSFSLLEEKNAFSEDLYFNSNFFRAFQKGNEEGNGLVFIDTGAYIQKEEDKVDLINNDFDDLLKKNDSAVIIVHSAKEMDVLRERYGQEKVFFGRPETKEEAVLMLRKGAAALFVRKENQEEFVTYVDECVLAYTKRRQALDNHFLSLSDYEAMEREGKILSEDDIDSSVNQILNLLISRTEVDKNEVVRLEEKSDDVTHPEPKLDPEKHYKNALLTSEEAIVLLKNKESVLPLTRKERVALIGDGFLEETVLPKESSLPEKESLLSLFEKTNLIFTGFAHGFLNKTEGSEGLAERACLLAKESDLALIYLDVKDNAIPEVQQKLVEKVAGVCKVAVILRNETYVDLSIEKYCHAIIYANDLGSTGTLALARILTGKVSPSGKLTYSYPVMISSTFSLIPHYSQDMGDLYPFGHGLTYTTFEYSDLKITEKGVSFNITNTGSTEAKEVPQMYIGKEGRPTLLKGYSKLSLKAGETKKVIFPFFESTFRHYDEKTGRYGVEGGTYFLRIGSSYADVRLEGELKLKSSTDTRDDFTTILIDTDGDFEKAYSDLAISHEDVKRLEEKRGLTFGKRLAVLITAFSYAFVFCFLVLFFHNQYFSYFSFDALTIIFLALLVVSIGIFVPVLIYLLRHKEKYSDVSTNETLTNLLSTISKFDESQKMTFDVPEEKEEEVLPEETSETPEEAAETEEPVEAIEETESTETVEEVPETPEEEEPLFETEAVEVREVAYDGYESFEDLVMALVNYSRENGYVIEMDDAKGLIAALASNHLIFIETVNQEDLISYLPVVSSFFNSDTSVTSCYNEWKKESDLLIEDNHNSAFLDALCLANADKERIVIAPLTNVRIPNLTSYFGKMIKFALNPAEPMEMNVGGGSVNIPQNIRCILISGDGNLTDIMPRYLADASIVLSLALHACERADEVTPVRSMSFSKLEEITHETRKDFFLSENNYAHLDEIEDKIAKEEKFAIGNKNALQMEKFCAACLSCAMEEADVFDRMLAFKIVPLIKTTAFYQGENGEKFTREIFNTALGQDDYKLTRKALIKNPESNPFLIEEPKEAEVTAEAALTEETPAAEETAALPESGTDKEGTSTESNDIPMEETQPAESGAEPETPEEPTSPETESTSSEEKEVNPEEVPSETVPEETDSKADMVPPEENLSEEPAAEAQEETMTESVSEEITPTKNETPEEEMTSSEETTDEPVKEETVPETEASAKEKREDEE